VEIRSRWVEDVRGLRMHVLESGERRANAKLVLLLHGFPELAFSWRKVLPALARAGYYVVAPDQRGFGQTTGWDDAYCTDLENFSMPALAQDAMALVQALGYEQCHCVVGHDFGSPVAAWSALLFPEVFRSLVMMSAPVGGPALVRAPSAMSEQLRALQPPRKHYQAYFSLPTTNMEMLQAPQGLAQFLRAYYHVKSADWSGNRGANKPAPLQSVTAQELGRLPRYYVMDFAANMPETVATLTCEERDLGVCQWLTENELSYYVRAYSGSGFQGGLNWYRAAMDAQCQGQMQHYQGRTIDVPAMFIAGQFDWGVVQKPGELERMREQLCTDWRATVLIEQAGHWVQQENADAVNTQLLSFLGEIH
jgi:pimeloyl-ACP methyl ester carboxylesterase